MKKINKHDGIILSLMKAPALVSMALFIEKVPQPSSWLAASTKLTHRQSAAKDKHSAIVAVRENFPSIYSLLNSSIMGQEAVTAGGVVAKAASH